MSFKTAAIITTSCFLLGVLLSGLGNADWPLLYTSNWTVNDLDRAERYYLTLFEAPGAVPALLHGMVGVCLIALSAKLAKWQETNLFFDGSSLALVVAAMALYGTVTVPNLRTLARQPIGEQQLALAGRMRAWLKREMATGADLAKPPPLDDQLRYEVLSLVCAANNLIIALLVGVVLFQASQVYAHWQYERELKKMAAEDAVRKQQ